MASALRRLEANDRGGTPLHQVAYSNRPEIAAHLISAGASVEVEAHGAGGTPLIVALFWGIAKWRRPSLLDCARQSAYGGRFGLLEHG